MPQLLRDPEPAAAPKPAYTIIKQKHSRWWEVREPGERAGVPDRVTEGRARGGAAARGVRRTGEEINGSRGRDRLRLPRCLPSGLT